MLNKFEEDLSAVKLLKISMSCEVVKAILLFQNKPAKMLMQAVVTCSVKM